MSSSLEQRLRSLFVLQNIDSQLDELEAQKGDLPKAVAELEDTLKQMRQQLHDLEESVTRARMDRDKADVDIIGSNEKIQKLKNQQFEVRSNREYDALTKEIAHAETMIEKLQKQMEELEGKMKTAGEDIERVKADIEQVEKEFEEKQRELREVSEANEDEELKLRHEREKIVVRIEKSDMALYDRIRGAKGGLAVVSVKRGSCGGCHNRIPPQRLLELRQHTTLYKCEHCGRILVSDEIVSTTTIPS